MTPAQHAQVRFTRGFLHDRVRVNRQVTVPLEYRQLVETGRIDALRLGWKPGEKNRPHEFWDSDIGKWLEAAAYNLATQPDESLQQQVNDTIALLAASQQPDGYLNTHFSSVRPSERWTNLRDAHELYCGGHLFEATVALHEATGSRALLDVMCRYVDYIDSVLGPAQGKNRGYCGHPEIELALVRLYRVTRDPKHLKLAKFFIDERGREPNYFTIEAAARGENPKKHWTGLDYYQAHKPVRQQTDADGHAVRLLYLLCGMVDVAAETDDQELLDAARRIWKSAAQRRMYITGGVGSLRRGEQFTFDYDLPNETAYAETCAAIALIFAAHRLLQIEADAAYADIIEKALYNGVLSGVSLAGDRFFYANPLTVHREALTQPPRSHISGVRQEWFGCACCPPNLARLLASLGQYAYSTRADAIFVHLYGASDADLAIGDLAVQISQSTDYPWDGKVKLSITPSEARKFTLALRIPDWCGNAAVKVNGKRVKLGKLRRGYAYISRRWKPGDRVTMRLEMPVRRIATNPRSRNNIGKVALQRGPVVYCLEEADNGPDLHLLSLGNGKLRARFEPNLLGGVVTIRGKGRRIAAGAMKNALYGDAPRRMKSRVATLKAVPYCVWGNRDVGEMAVWVRSDNR